MKTLIFIFAIALSLLSTGCQSSRVGSVTIRLLDFVPVQGGYNPTCPGTSLRYSDVKHYRPVIELAAPAPTGFTAEVWVMERRFFWGDPTLGRFFAQFNEGATTPDQITTENTNRLFRIRRPEGSPRETTGSFWLGCTMKCVIRGNVGFGDDSVAPDVYLKVNYLFDLEEPLNFNGVTTVRRHTVRCVR